MGAFGRAGFPIERTFRFWQEMRGSGTLFGVRWLGDPKSVQTRTLWGLFWVSSIVRLANLSIWVSRGSYASLFLRLSSYFLC